LLPEQDTLALKVGGLPVKVLGIGSDGKPFIANAVANELSPRGARLDGIAFIKTPGEIIGVQYGNRKARFRVVWVLESNSPEAAQIGIKTLDTSSSLWPADMLAAQQDIRFNWFNPTSGSPQEERRQYARYRCSGNVGFRTAGAERHIWGKLAEIGLGGCYIEIAAPCPVGTKLEITVQVQGAEMPMSAEVRTAVPAMGMGVEFTIFKGDVRERLKQFIQKLAPPRRQEVVAKLGPDPELLEVSTKSDLQAPSEISAAVPPPETSVQQLAARIEAAMESSVSNASPMKLASDPTRFLSLLREFFSENDVLTREDFKRLLEESKS